MLVLRLLLLFGALVIVLSASMYIFTSDSRYLQFARKVVRITLVALLVFVTLYVLERYVLIAWKVLL